MMDIDGRPYTKRVDAGHALTRHLRRALADLSDHSVGYNPAVEGEVDVQTIRDAVVVVESRSDARPLRLRERSSWAGRSRSVQSTRITSTPRSVRSRPEIVRAARTTTSSPWTSRSGVAAQDATATALVWHAARARGVGQRRDVTPRFPPEPRGGQASTAPRFAADRA
jgi:hypothetical protein